MDNASREAEYMCLITLSLVGASEGMLCVLAWYVTGHAVLLAY